MPETGSMEQSDNPNSPQRGPSENMRLRSLARAPKITILSVEAPPQVEIGKTFEIKIRFMNDGAAGKMWYRIIDAFTDQRFGEGILDSEARARIRELNVHSNDQISGGPEGEMAIVTIPWPSMPSNALCLRLEAGHVE